MTCFFVDTFINTACSLEGMRGSDDGLSICVFSALTTGPIILKYLFIQLNMQRQEGLKERLILQNDLD